MSKRKVRSDDDLDLFSNYDSNYVQNEEKPSKAKTAGRIRGGPRKVIVRPISLISDDDTEGDGDEGKSSRSKAETTGRPRKKEQSTAQAFYTIGVISFA